MDLAQTVSEDFAAAMTKAREYFNLLPPDYKDEAVKVADQVEEAATAAAVPMAERAVSALDPALADVLRPFLVNYKAMIDADTAAKVAEVTQAGEAQKASLKPVEDALQTA